MTAERLGTARGGGKPFPGRGADEGGTRLDRQLLHHIAVVETLLPEIPVQAATVCGIAVA